MRRKYSVKGRTPSVADLVEKGVLTPYPGRVRKVEYAINYVKTDEFLNHFSDIWLI